LKTYSDNIIFSHDNNAVAILEFCSLPFTYNGSIYYRCEPNLAGLQPCGCRKADFSLSACATCSGIITTTFWSN